MNALPRAVEPNVTPLIDVMLVLLIVFMVITPVSTRSLDSALPRPPADGIAIPRSTAPVVAVRGDDFLVDGRSLGSLAELESQLRDLLATRTERTVFVRVEGQVAYGRAVAAMDAARGAGADRIGLLGLASPAPLAAQSEDGEASRTTRNP
jgi:biopolymer transport protein ExbD